MGAMVLPLKILRQKGDIIWSVFSPNHSGQGVKNGLEKARMGTGIPVEKLLKEVWARSLSWVGGQKEESEWLWGIFWRSDRQHLVTDVIQEGRKRRNQEWPQHLCPKLVCEWIEVLVPTWGKLGEKWAMRKTLNYSSLMVLIREHFLCYLYKCIFYVFIIS